MRAAHTSTSKQQVSGDLTRSPLQRLQRQAHRAVQEDNETSLLVVPPQDASEAQADRIADSLEGAHRNGQAGLSSQPRSLQRQEQGKSGESKQPSDEEKYKEAAKKVGEAFLETEVGKNIKNEAERLGKSFLATLPGKIITGTAAAGAVSYLFARNAELPAQIPSIPLDFMAPGLSVQLTYEGPVRSPTKAMITFSYSLGGGAKSSEKKPAMSDREKYQAETERMRADQEKFRRGLMTPQQRADEDREFWDAFWRMKAQDPSNPLNLPGLRPKKEEGFSLQRKAAGAGGPARAPSIVHEVLQQPGAPLDGSARAYLENRLGHDFSSVRIHTGAHAEASAQAVRAEAYTVGNQIVFARGQYDPGSSRGLKLLAHELVHVVQQSGVSQPLPELDVLPAGAPEERAAEQTARNALDEPQSRGEAAQSGRGEPSFDAPQIRSGAVVARVDPPPGGAAPACPTNITLNVSDPLHVPACGTITPRATADVAGVTWSLHPDPTAVDASTSIATNGNITIGASQTAGQIKVRATSGTCFAELPIRLRSHPTGINSTRVVGPPTSANDYGGVFDHTFISNDGNVASLEDVAVGERFIGIPNPTAATHNITAPTNPFGGTFTLHTATLTQNASNNWFLTNTGSLGGTFDNVTMGKAGVNVGRFIQSHSNPNPPQGLPATMTITQGLHWFCPQDAPANRWRMPAFVQVGHSRTLRNQRGVVQFVTTVNGVERIDTYEGPVGVTNLTASPVNSPRSAAAPAAPRTVRITVDTLPSALPAGQALNFSLVGNALGCAIAPDPADDHAAVLTIGTTAGTVTVQAADSTNTNQARVSVLIT